MIRTAPLLAAVAVMATGLPAIAGTAMAQGAPTRLVTQPIPPPPPPGETTLTTQGGGQQNQNPGGPRAPGDRIDTSVCDLATFDFEKCLGGRN